MFYAIRSIYHPSESFQFEFEESLMSSDDGPMNRALCDVYYTGVTRTGVEVQVSASSILSCVLHSDFGISVVIDAV